MRPGCEDYNQVSAPSAAPCPALPSFPLLPHEPLEVCTSQLQTPGLVLGAFVCFHVCKCQSRAVLHFGAWPEKFSLCFHYREGYQAQECLRIRRIARGPYHTGAQKHTRIYQGFRYSRAFRLRHLQ